MEALAAVLYQVNEPLRLEQVEVLPPGPYEVQVRMQAQVLSPGVQNGNHSHLYGFGLAKFLKRFPSRFK